MQYSLVLKRIFIGYKTFVWFGTRLTLRTTPLSRNNRDLRLRRGGLDSENLKFYSIGYRLVHNGVNIIHRPKPRSTSDSDRIWDALSVSSFDKSGSLGFANVLDASVE